MAKMTNEDFINGIKTKLPDFFNKFEILEEYKGNKVPISIKCRKCDDIFKKDPMHLMRGQGCPNCAGKKKNTEWFIKKVYELTDDEYSVLGEYITGKTKIKLRHNGECGNEFDMRPEDFENGQRCPKCARKTGSLKKRKTDEEFKKIVKELVLDEYTVLGTYTTSTEKIRMKHNSCGSEFFVAPGLFIYPRKHANGKFSGSRCPVCYGSIKKTDEEIRAIIELDPDYEYITRNIQKYCF